MNFYLVVEGEVVEVAAYKKWLTYVRPEMTIVNHISEIRKNNFSIISGYGYPQYFEVINAAIEDVNRQGNIDRLIFVVDTERMTIAEKDREIRQNVDIGSCKADFRIVFQHFCIETWALANRKITPRQPQNEDLIEFRKICDVLLEDPEELPDLPARGWTRVKFAYRYLKLLLQERARLNFSKSNPQAILTEDYFNEINSRFRETSHIRSFATFLDAVSKP